MKSPIKYLAPFTSSLQWIFDYLGGGEFLPSNFIMDWLADTVCDSDYSVEGMLRYSVLQILVKCSLEKQLLRMLQGGAY